MDPFIGSIHMFGGNFAPRGYALCNGQLLSISEYSALFSLIGTTYGGDGVQTFALPDLRGRVPVGQGSGPGLTPRVMGESFGSETVSLTASQLPVHRHAAQASLNVASSASGPSAAPGTSSTAQYYGAGAPNLPMSSLAVDSSGGGQPHDNMAPSLPFNFIIALEGIFPSRN